MSLFSEKHHAFVSATFYRIIKENGFHDYRTAFRMAVRLYAQQRGSRMAQRALRDGRPLDFASYRYYGEWEYTPGALAAMPRHFESVAEGCDVKMIVHSCPWKDQYYEMGLPDGALDYCADLDCSIARGFNPELAFEVGQTLMQEGNEFCVLYQREANIGAESAYGPRNPENIMCWSFHCGHVYKTFSDVFTAVYGEKGAEASGKAIAAFAEAYGDDMAQSLAGFKAHDFSYI